MQITFPFLVKQVDRNTIQIETSIDGHRLVEIRLHPDIKVGDSVYEKLHIDATLTVIKESMTIDLKV